MHARTYLGETVGKEKNHHKLGGSFFGGAAGIRCISASRKLRSHRRPAGDEPVSTGHWHKMVRILLLIKKQDTPVGYPVFWRSSRDSNPGGTFVPYEISSHASSTSLSTAPYSRIIIPIIRRKINRKLQLRRN